MPLSNYLPTSWVNALTAINQARLNNIESGIDTVTDAVIRLQDGPYLNVRDFGAVGDFDGTSGTDDTTAIQAALSAATGPQIVYLPSNKANGGFTRYKTTSPLTLKAGNRLHGDWGATEIAFLGSDSASCINLDHTGLPSRLEIRDIFLRDYRTNSSRTGNGINADRWANDLRILNVFVSGFQDGFYIGSTVGGTSGDFSILQSCWASNPLRYGFNFERMDNIHSVIHCQCDTDTGTAGLAAIRVGGASGASLNILGFKHESENGADTLLIDDDTPPSTTVIGLGQTKGPGTGDVVQFNYNTQTAVTLINVSAAVGAAANLLRHTPQGYTIAAAASGATANKRITRWVSGEGLMVTDRGNADYALASSDRQIQRFNTPLTANRTVTLPTSSSMTQATYKVVRGAGATGAFNLNVSDGSTTIKALGTVSTWAEFHYDGSAWFQVGGGSL